MKQIKLEVGKTYRNRKGEEVSIVEKDNAVEYPFRGSDDEWYTESGKVINLCIAKSEQDLIEEVAEIPSETSHTFALVPEALTATRYTFTIPEGTKGINVSKEGNRIVVEMVPEKGPKPGDVMINEYDSVYIFKEDVGNGIHEHYALLVENGRFSIEAMCHPGRLATPEEAQPLWDALKKAGKRWNPESMQMEEVPKPGDVCINDVGSVYIFKEAASEEVHRHYAWLGRDASTGLNSSTISGRPATPEEAQPLWDALKKAGKKWNPETMQVEDVPERERIMDFLQRYANDVTLSYEQLCELIEFYIKYKEGEQ